MSHTQERIIPRPPSDVWRIMTDWKVAEFWLGISRLRAPNDAPMRVGSELTYVVRGVYHPLKIEAWAPPRELTLTTRQGGIEVRYAYTLESTSTGTRVQRIASCTGRGVWGFFALLLEWIMRVADRQQLVALERLVRITTGSGR